MGSQSQPPPLPLPTNTRTHVFVCISIPNISTKIIYNYITSPGIYKIVSAFVLVRALGFLRLNLTCPMDTRAIVYKALFGPRFRVCKDYFDSLSDRRSDKRCEGAGKTACELLYSQSRVGVVGSQGIQKQASLTLSIIYQRGCMSGLVEFWSIWVSPPVCLFGRFQLDLGFWLNMLLRRVTLEYTTPWILAESGGIYFPRDF